MKILIVEDNERVAQFLAKGLAEAGHTVDRATNARDGLFLAVGASHDVIVLDRMLPEGVDGLGIVGALRQTGNHTPILILSALADIDERIKGLRAGGDDYLAKPFALGELLARLEVLARRAQGGAAAETVLRVGDLQMDLLSRTVSRAGRPIALQPREFKMLEYMMRRPEQVVTRTMLLENVWDYHFDPQTNIVDVHVSRLRHKLDAGLEWSMLKTVRGAGYMLSASRD